MKPVIGRVFAWVALLVAASGARPSEPPKLPSGLGGAPNLSPGLGGTPSDSLENQGDEAIETFASWSGFWETRVGYRLGNAAGYSDASLMEFRIQGERELELGAGLLDLSVDLIADGESDRSEFDWERGRGAVDVRSLNYSFGATRKLELKLGRQVATWGVGDLVFINDLFPKDWNSFFLGRDLEYLKVPQDSARFSRYGDWANIDLVYSPRFEPDRFIDGERLAYWDAAKEGIATAPSAIAVGSPGDAIDADELHLRISRLFGRLESSLYGYRGFWKSPAGTDLASGKTIFPKLDVVGASIRFPFRSGIFSAEIGFYDSSADGTGTDPLIRNSESRLLFGYEREVGRELTASVQYYVERTRDFAAASGIGDRDRELVTLRLKKRLWQQTLDLGLFVFYSPRQKDSYTRLNASWKASDHWKWDVGANLFGGADSSFFGQFAGNENVYLSLRRFF